MGFDKEMQRALEADGEKLRQLTGEDHGPFDVAELPNSSECRCGRCGNPIPKRSFRNPAWERCLRCIADESNEQDMLALRRKVALKRSQGRKW